MAVVDMAPLRVAICGGGIGGLSLALVLKKFVRDKNLTVDLYEAGPQFTEIGAGISIWERSRYILRELGLEDALKNKAVSPPMLCRKSDTQDPFIYAELKSPHGSIALPRSEMLNFLLEGISSTAQQDGFLKTYFSKRLVRYEQDPDGVVMHFQDGSTAQATTLIGADGIGSATRKTMYTELAERVRTNNQQQAEAFSAHVLPTWTGIYLYRTLIDAAKLKAVAPNHIALSKGLTWSGIGTHAVTYPISSTIVNTGVGTYVSEGHGKPLEGPTVVPASKQDILSLVKDWENDMQVFFETADEVSRWTISEVHGLPQFMDGRMALLGDSAHAMIPYIGAEAGQAIEDAYILGRILAYPSVTARNIADALKVYDAVRRPIAQDAAERSRRQGHILEFHQSYLPPDVDFEKVKLGDRDEFVKIAKEVEDIFSFHNSKMPGEDWDRARELLEAALHSMVSDV